MRCVSVFENPYRDKWVVYAGMDQRKDAELDTFGGRTAAVEYATRRSDETVLVVESGDYGYTEKIEL